MKLKTAFISLLLLAGVLYGGAKGYIHYRVSSELDKIIPLVSPFAEIRYQGIGSSLEGSITVENIRIYPSDSDDEITVGSVRIAGDGLPFLYRLMRGDFQNSPPERFKLSIEGFSVPLDGALAVHYADALKAARQAGGVKDPDGCGVMTGLSPDLLGALGFYAITMDAALDVDFDPAAGRAGVWMDLDLHGIQYSRVRLLLSHLAPPGSAAAGRRPLLSGMEMTYRIDPDFVARAQQYCAASRGLTVEAFIASMLDMDERQLARQLGFEPGPGLMAAIRRFIRDPQEVRLSIHPPEAIAPGSLSFYRPEELPEMLNLKLAVNGEPVTDLRFRLPAPAAAGPDERPAGLASRLPDAKALLSSAAGQSERRRRAAPAREYLPTPIARLHDYLDRNVRIYVGREGVVRRGVLVSMTKEQLTIKQRLSGGEMTVQVPLRQISRVEVYRRP